MPVISDQEIRRRLKAHNYPVPPITELTRNVLIKKLSQLDKEAGKSKPSSKLLEYSSAEEDGPAKNSPHLRRRKVQGSSQNSISNGNSQNSRRTSKVAARPSVSNERFNQQETRHRGQLMQLSDEDDEGSSSSSENDDDEAQGENEEDEEDDDDDDDNEEDDEEEAERQKTTNIGLQTSLYSPSSPTNGRSSINGNRKSQRFANTSPVPSVRSTASYMNNTQAKSGYAPTSTPLVFGPNSPLRRGIEKNREAFGSLGMITSLSSLINVALR